MMKLMNFSTFFSKTNRVGNKSGIKISVLLVMFCFFAFTNAFGTTYSHTISSKTWSAYGAQTLTGVSWTAAATGGSYWGYDATKGQQFGSSGSPAKPLTLTTSGITGTITSIVVTTSGASSVAGTVSVSVGGTAFSPATASLTSTNAAYTFTGSASGSITITWNQSSSKALYLKAIEVTYSSSSAPTLTSPTATSITTTTATLGANVTVDGGAALTARGTVWGTTASPTGNAVAASGTTTGVFTHTRTGFTANTKYYYRGYATNSVGTAYSGDGTFVTLPNAPGIDAGSGATTNSLIVNWIAPTGGSVAFTYEIQVDDNSDFSSLAFSQSNIASTNTSITATGLAPATSYYYRVRANNATGSSDWSSISVAYSTISANVPTLTASALADFGNVCTNSFSTNTFTVTGSALTSGNITVDTQDPGFTFSVSVDGTYSTSISFYQSGGAFSQIVYVKYTPTKIATENADINISGGGASTYQFTTSGVGVNNAPIVDTPTSASITATTAVLGGNISDLGCTNVTMNGIEWSTTNGFANGTGTVVSSSGDFQTGTFTQRITGLTPSTVIYFKAFATNAGGTTYTSQSSFVTNALSVPVATAATNVGRNEFTANWDAVEGATEYNLNVYQRIGGGTQTVLSENFDNFSSGSTGSGASSSDVSTSLDSYTQTAGWTGSKIYHAGGTAKFGTSSALGYIVSPAINLSANGGAFNLSFQSMAWSGDATSLKIYLNDVLVYTVTGLNNSDYTLGSFSVDLTGGNASSIIKFEGGQASKGRFFLENIVITQGGETITQASGSPFTVTEGNSKVIDGLSSATTFNYTVTAKDINGLETAKSNEITVSTTSGTSATDYFRSKATGNWSELTTWESSENGSDNWISATAVPTSSATSIYIENGNEVTVTNPATASSVIVKPTANLTLNDGESLSADHLTIQSDATGTGTFLNNGTATITTVTANQYLSSARNWYVSSPVSAAVAPSGFTYYQRDEAGASWTTQPFVAGNTFVQGKGYIALPDAAGSTLTFTGQLNTDNVDVSLSWSGASSKGFNLIGNPYPSHLTWTKEFTDANASLIEPTIYYRTNSGNSNNNHQWSNPTFNAHTGASVGGASKIIPPMQAIWVKAIAAGTLTLDKSLLTRSHQGSNPLKVSPIDESKRLRLVVSDGQSSDEILIYFNANASNGYDAYDSPKMINGVNSTVPDMYTMAGAEQLVINGMNDIPSEIPLYFNANASKSSQFSLSTTEISNFEAQTLIYIKNNKTGEQQLISDGTTYSFDAAAAGNSPSFSLIFRVNNATTDLRNNNNSVLNVYANAEGQITVSLPSVKENVVASVYNSLGQCVMTQPLTATHTVLNKEFTSGAYVVKVNGVSRKVVIE